MSVKYGTLNNNATGAIRTELIRRYINPLWYGATGDGVTDDSAAMEAALSDAVTKKVPLFIPALNFVWTDASPIITDGLMIFGTGYNSIITSKSATKPVLQFGDATHYPGHNVLQGVALYGNDTAPSCLNLYDTANFSAYNIACRHAANWGIDITSADITTIMMAYVNLNGGNVWNQALPPTGGAIRVGSPGHPANMTTLINMRNEWNLTGGHICEGNGVNMIGCSLGENRYDGLILDDSAGTFGTRAVKLQTCGFEGNNHALAANVAAIYAKDVQDLCIDTCYFTETRAAYLLRTHANAADIQIIGGVDFVGVPSSIADETALRTGLSSILLRGTAKGVFYPPIGVSGVYGSYDVLWINLRSIAPPKIKLTAGTVAAPETLRIKVELIWYNSAVTSFEKAFTTPGGSYWLTDDDFLGVWRNLDRLRHIKVYAKSDQAATTATARMDVFGGGMY